MAKIRFCPKCMNIIKRKDEKCSQCGMLVSDMEAELENAKLDKEIAELKQELAEEQNVEESQENVNTENSENKPKRHKHKRKLNPDAPKYTVDEEGNFNIDTRDVTFLDNSSYSAKKEKGEYKPEKIEWWEIYKWADRHLARRKIMKEVNKAAKERPTFISKAKMLALCFFFGYMGAHNYYAKNYKKAILMNVSIVIACVFVGVPALASVATFFGGGFGFIAFYLWISDFIMLLIDKFKYRLSKEAFIAKLNVETRYKISKKYLHTDKIKEEQRRIKEKLQQKLEKKEAKRRAKSEK